MPTKPCEPGCTCGLHVGKSRPCVEGCTCGKHTPFTEEHRRKIAIGRTKSAARKGLKADRESDLNRSRQRKHRALKRLYGGRGL